MLATKAAAAATIVTIVIGVAATTRPNGEPAVQAQCANPSFRVPHGSPFTVSTKPKSADIPQILASGSFKLRSGADRGCACDLAVAVSVGTSSVPDAVVLMQGSADGTFSPATQGAIEVSNNPIALVSGRFDSASALDSLVVVSTSGLVGTATILHPNAEGVYVRPTMSPSEWATGEAPSAAAAGDFNGDDKLDVVIANQRSRSLTILVGNGAGTFEPTPLTVKGLQGAPVALAAGEFTGGGARDVAVVTSASATAESTIVIVEGSKSGTFPIQQPMPLGQRGSFEPLIAAVNLTRPGIANSSSARDLVVAFADLAAGGQPAARFKVFLGKDGGGFVSASASQDQAFGDRAPRALAVADLDNDSAPDLAISTFGDTGEGAIRLFRGNTSARIGFHAVTEWEPIPSTNRQDWLVSGRFGPKPAENVAAHTGLAAINVTTPRTVGVYLGNGQGAFVEPQIITTPLEASPDLFVTADFHSANGAAALELPDLGSPDPGSPLLDIAYVTRSASASRLAVLGSSGGGGFADRVVGSAGANPLLIAAGAFVGTDATKRPTDVAVLDVPSTSGPILKVFLNNGSGTLASPVESLLPAGAKPTAMVAGRFRGTGAPVDIALFRERTMVMLLNDGKGRFTQATNTVDALVVPGAVAASRRLRRPEPPNQARTDIVVKERDGNRIVFLVNVDTGFRVADTGGGVFGGAGNVNDVLLGNVAGSALDDVVTYDGDMTVRVLGRLDTSEGFEVPQVSKLPSGITFGFTRYFLSDFGDGKLGLAAAAIVGGKSGILTLQGDSTGVFTTGAPASGFNPFDLRPIGESRAANHFQQTRPTSRTAIETRFGAVGRFRSSLQGNSKPDLAFVTMIRGESFADGLCPGIPPSQAPPPPREEKCPEFRACFPDEKPIPPGNVCFDNGDTPCCFCKFACPKRCNVTPPPMLPFCRTTRESLSISVFGNTCGE